MTTTKRGGGTTRRRWKKTRATTNAMERSDGTNTNIIIVYCSHLEVEHRFDETTTRGQRRVEVRRSPRWRLSSIIIPLNPIRTRLKNITKIW